MPPKATPHALSYFWQLSDSVKGHQKGQCPCLAGQSSKVFKCRLEIIIVYRGKTKSLCLFYWIKFVNQHSTGDTELKIHWKSCYTEVKRKCCIIEEIQYLS